MTSQSVLKVLGRRLGILHVREIQKTTGLTEDQVQDALQTLVRRGYVQRRGEGNVKATTQGLAFLHSGARITSGPRGPRVAETEGTSLRSRLWRALRLSQKASIPELLMLADRGGEGNARENAKQYLNALVRSGHVVRLSRRAECEHPITKGPTRYSLALNTGPLPPQYNRRQKRVFDPNTGKAYDVA